MFCSNCGMKQAHNTDFCSNCGIKLENIEEAQKEQVHKKYTTGAKGIAILLVLVIAIVLIARSCSGSSSPQNLLIGTWDDGQGLILIFERRGSLQISEGRHTADGTWEIGRGNTLYIYFPLLGEEETFAWADNEENVRWNEWFITGDRLYFEGDILTRR
jgi:hypothetical protein